MRGEITAKERWRFATSARPCSFLDADLDRVFALADRILVVGAGRIVHETPIIDAKVEVIGKHMACHR